MAQRVFIRVVGFSDVERHALNTVFRLSEDQDTHYSLWTAEAPQPPQLALLDAEAYESRFEAESATNAGLKFIWVGEGAPGNTWRVFHRPIAWMEVVQAMDQLFSVDVLDFDLDGDDNGPATQPPPPEEPAKRALIASADRDERLYLRAKLALAQLTLADEATTPTELMEMVRSKAYEVALVDFRLGGAEGWQMLNQLTSLKPRIPHVIVTKDRVTVFERVRAWFGGAEAFFDKPPHPGKLQSLLQKV